MARRRRSHLAARWLFASIVAMLLATQGRVGAFNHDVHIKEVMGGAIGNSKIQFIVLEQEASGENLWGPQPGETQSRAMLVFFDAIGRETGIYKFPSDAPAGSPTQTFPFPALIATQDFANLPGAPTPDFIIPPLLNAISGKVCFKNNPANGNAFLRNECLSYGDFTGDTESNFRDDPAFGVLAGPPAASLAIVNRASLFRTIDTGHNADFQFTGNPSPINSAGATFSIPLPSDAEQGETMFNTETFLGNGRTCASCHIASDGLRLTPENVHSRFLAVPSTFDPLFVGETKPSDFDSGFDFNLNTLTLTAAVATGAPCTGELRGVITAAGGIRARVLGRVSQTKYLVYGGTNPALSGTVTDGTCSATVASITSGDLGDVAGSMIPGIEEPGKMRTSVSPAFPHGRALILENIDGFSNPPVFRKPPHLLNLNKTGPYGFNGNFVDLLAFGAQAVVQHFPRTLARNAGGTNPDFRMPTNQERVALEAFMLAQEFPPGNDPNKFDLDRFATTDAQKRGRTAFFGSAKCSQCHGGTVLAFTTVSIQGKPAGLNASFNTGVVNQAINGPGEDNQPCEPSVGICGSREFSVPQLFNVKNLGPFFHDGSASTVHLAVAFYTSPAFSSSPAGVAIGGITMSPQTIDDITAFLNGLVVRPYTMSPTSVSFGDREVNAGPTAGQNIVVTNTGSSPLTFTCTITGADPGEFAITSCPGTALAAGQSRAIQVVFDPASIGVKAAILEINAADPSGIALSGTGVCATCFTDNVLVAASSVIRAVHITELRQRIDVLRTRFGLAAFAWTDATLTPGATIIRAQHITDLRTALSQVYDAAGRTRPTYTDPVLTAGVIAKALHVSEIRAAVQAIE
jgi:hypothetical protein